MAMRLDSNGSAIEQFTTGSQNMELKLGFMNGKFGHFNAK